ncbi:MAG: sulfite exporter TauE/SafE family protein [Elusimicrobia bacterium]|nr:sulfite exporter TauE/SafE family protein [Elusimicrobiota bacterium]
MLNWTPNPAEAAVLLAPAVLIIAFLYSSVGHAGASGYIAVMTLFSLAPEQIKPVALSLNILVASIASWQFWRAGHFSWPLFWPFAALAAPCAFIGGYLNLPTRVFKVVVGLILLASAARFLVRPPAEQEPRAPSRGAALCAGAGLGLLAGLTGTGGGIFLTPLVIFMRWGRTKSAAAVSALFILLNSIAGLLGNLSATRRFPDFAWPLAAAVVCGGTAGSYLGSRKLPHAAIKRLLAVVLTIAGAKLIFTP